MKKVGFIGLGIMGQGMAGQLLQKGFELVIWNRDQSKATALVQQGAGLAQTPAELASEVEVVISMVRDDAAARQVILGPGGVLAGARRGTAIIDMSTVTPMMVRELAAAIEAKGCTYLEAPVTGSKDAAATGKLNILVGGSAAVLQEQRPVLEALSQTITHVGPHGTAAVLKLANNQAAAVMMAALGESLALCEAAGLDRAMVMETLAGAVARVSNMKKDKIIHRDWDTTFALELMHKDLVQTMQAAAEARVAMPLLAAASEIYRQAISQGQGELDFAVIVDKKS